MGLWRRSYPEVVDCAHAHMAAMRYLAAGREYWLAAFVAPSDHAETEMLIASWVATERAQGRVSELEGLR